MRLHREPSSLSHTLMSRWRTSQVSLTCFPCFHLVFYKPIANSDWLIFLLHVSKMCLSYCAMHLRTRWHAMQCSLKKWSLRFLAHLNSRDNQCFSLLTGFTVRKSNGMKLNSSISNGNRCQRKRLCRVLTAGQLAYQVRTPGRRESHSKLYNNDG